jgi:hypothetical protein
VRLFGRREPEHVRLAREGGIPLGDDRPRAAWDAAGIHGLHRPRQWDAVVTVEEPELQGERAAFVALEDGTLVVEEGPNELAPLAAALETKLAPPYRAEAVRREGGLWAVAGRAIHVVELPGIEGEELEVVMHGADHLVSLDGERAFVGSLPALERSEHVARARRIDGALWEVQWDPL